MEVERPGPGEQLGTSGPPAIPRPAATVIVLRGGDAGLEVLLVQRNPTQRFMGGVWVFPGGAVDPDDGEGADGLRAAAVRELAEEAGVALAHPDALVPYSRWITPAILETRFDTWFYLAPLPDGAEPRVDGRECVDMRWSTPRAALEAYMEGELVLVFPTVKHLEQLSAFPSAEALLEYARGREVLPVEPRGVGAPERARILLPGEQGYDD